MLPSWKDFSDFYTIEDMRRVCNEEGCDDGFFEDRFYSVIAGLEELSFPLTVYRGIQSKTDREGRHWSLDRKVAEEFAGKNGSVLTKEVSAKQIDWYHTIFTRLAEDFEEQEKEITLLVS